MFLPSDDVLPRPSVVVLSESFWRTRFNADPGIVGRRLTLDAFPYTVVGVAPDEVQVFGRTSMWAMYPIQQSTARGMYLFRVVGRVKSGLSLKAADADLAAISGTLAQEFPKTNAGRGVAIEPMRDVVIGGELRRTSMLFLGVVAFVLLICCANVANLLLARGTARTRELAVRTALGADRRRVIQQLLTESLLLAASGGALGLVVGAGLLRVAGTMIPPGLLPQAVALTFDLRVVSFCAAAALIVGVLFGLAPAWQATSVHPAEALASGGRATTIRGGRFRGTLVAFEVATAVALLFGAGLLLRTLLVVTNVDRGYRAGNALTMMIDPVESKYPTPAARLVFYEAIEREVASLPGVRGVGWASTLPLGDLVRGSNLLRDRRRSAAAREPDAGRRLPDRQPVVLPRARLADRGRPRLRQPGYDLRGPRSASSTKRSSAPISTGAHPSACRLPCAIRPLAGRRRASGKSSAWRDR